MKHHRLLIGGDWVDGDGGTSDVTNPATEEVVGQAPEASIEQAHAAARAAVLVQTAAGQSRDPRIIVLDRKLPWERAVYEGSLNEALFVVYPNEDGTAWYCRAIPPEPNSFGQRLALPEAWRGLRDEAFWEAAGIEDGVFCHPSGFICGARSRASTIRLATQAIAAGAHQGT